VRALDRLGEFLEQDAHRRAVCKGGADGLAELGHVVLLKEHGEALVD
jgi:hypothetical protein